MTFSFPTDKTQLFVADNGVTYEWSEDRWRVKEYLLATGAPVALSGTPPSNPDDGDLWFDTTPTELTLYVYSEDSSAWIPAAPPTSLESRVTAGEALQQEIITRLTANEGLTGNHTDQIDDLQNQVNDLGITKGKVARYEVVNNIGTPVSRNGEFSTNTSFYLNINLMSFGIEDADGALTKPMADGDIIETVNPTDSKVNRYKITSAAGAPTVVGVEYISGSDSYVIGNEKQFFIYPQNESGVSKQYVDDQDDLRLNKTGGTLTGTLNSKVGTTNTTAFGIKNTTDDKACVRIWAPGGAGSQTKYVGRNDTDHWFQVYDDTDNNPITTAKFEYEGYSFLAKPNISYSATDAHYFKGRAIFNKSGGDYKLDIGQSNTDFYTKARFKDGLVVKGENQAIGGDNVFFASAEYVAYSGRIENDTDIVTKAYVDSTVGSTSSTPLGAVIMWFGTTAPDGWLICDGSSFSTTTYAALHTHLQTVPNYAAGKTPDFRGLYPGGAGSAYSNQLTQGGENKTNIYHSQRTAAPNGGYPNSTASIPNGNTRTYNGAGGTNAYADGISKVNITEGWDNVTRPPTLSVHFIIKAV